MDQAGRSAKLEYRPAANLVLESERPRGGRTNEPTGEAETLAGRAGIGRMGDRVARAPPKELEERLEKARKRKDAKHGMGGGERDGGASSSSSSSSSSAAASRGGYGSAAFDASAAEGLYVPRSKDTRYVWEQILTLNQRLLGDVPDDVLSGAANEVVAALRDSEAKEAEKKGKVADLLGTSALDEDTYMRLANMARALVDFSDENGGGKAGARASSSSSSSSSAAADGLDEGGVAVVFGDEEEDQGEYEDAVVEGDGLEEYEDQVAEDGEASAAGTGGSGGVGADGREGGNGNGNGTSGVHVDVAAEEAAAGGASAVDPDAADRAAGLIPVHDIDAFWLQRQVAVHVEDAAASLRLASDIQRVLGECVSPTSAADTRALENKLVTLLGFTRFDLIKTIVRNAARILYTTRLKQAQTEGERTAVRAEMVEDIAHGGPEILRRLEGGAGMSSEAWAQSRAATIGDRVRKEARELARGGSSAAGSNGGPAAAGASSSSSSNAAGDMFDDDSEIATTLRASGTASTVPGARGASALAGPAAAGAGPSSSAAAAAPVAVSAATPAHVIDLESLAFAAGSHFMANKKVSLPDKSWRAQKKGYEEVHVPAPKPRPLGPNEREVAITDMPTWAQPAFANMKALNRVQSRLYETALFSAENMLLCAPTGAGKTNVAVLSILHELGLHRNEDGTIDLDSFKVIYVAPMKALVQEVVANFTQRLGKPYGLNVRELSGDQNLTKAELAATQIIVTTPEKWDVITRKSGERTHTQLVRLIIIDEIHLLHDERGAVLESLVARTLRQVEVSAEMVRIVGLSATLPNYEDVATFLRVRPDRGLFTFDSSFRPAPLQLQYIGVTEKKPLKRLSLMNDICFEKVLEQGGVGKGQVLIFVHTRKETVRTARALKDMLVAADRVGELVREDSATREVLISEAEASEHPDLKDLLPFGFAVHHAGMKRADRALVEELFADGHVQVLVSTATLAWGVNLPAHTVIIKGTQIYNPELGKWAELSPLDVMQMLGRAGRPQYDTFGEGIIITAHSELQYYLSLTNQQLPIESQLVAKLADNLNAEIVLGSVGNIKDASHWLSYTYLYVRMLRSPALYGVQDATNTLAADPSLLQRRLDMVHSAAVILDRHNLIRYDRRSGSFTPTALGRVASFYYITHATMSTYNEFLKPTLTDLELFRLFALSAEFKNIVVRQEEKEELRKLLERVPIPVKETMEEPSAKVNVLLQAYISKLRMDGFAIQADTVYVKQSAGRLMRAIFEICLRRGWALLARRCLDLCKMIEHQQWMSASPLRQFMPATASAASATPPPVPEEILARLEKKDIPWERYPDLKPADLGELARSQKHGKVLHRLVHSIPRFEMSAHLLPLTRSLLRVELKLEPDFMYDPLVHGGAEGFWILVEDADGENILHHEHFVLKARYATEAHTLTFTVPLTDPQPPQYFVRILSDKWLHSEALLPLSFRALVLPDKFPPPTELLDLAPLPVTALGKSAYQALYGGGKISGGAPRITLFNPIQTQTFSALCEGDGNVLVAAPSGSGKTVCAEFALLRLFDQDPDARAVYISPSGAVARARYESWEAKFGEGLGKAVVELTGELTSDVKLLERAHIAIATPRQWDAISRRWKKRRAVSEVSLYICDDVDSIGEGSSEGVGGSGGGGGGFGGPTYEVVISRIRLMAHQLDRPIRIVALGNPMANARDIADWIGSGPSTSFNFQPQARPLPLEMRIQGFDSPSFAVRLMAMARPAYHAAVARASASDASSNASSSSSSTLIFVPSRKQAQLTAIDVMSFAAADGKPGVFLRADKAYIEEAIAAYRVTNAVLRQTLSSGVAFFHQGMNENDKSAVAALFAAGAIGVVVAPHSCTWSMVAPGWAAHTVVVMGTETYDGRTHQYVDMALRDVHHMLGRAVRPGGDGLGRALILCAATRKEFLKKFLVDPMPVESGLHTSLHDHINAEIVNKVIESKHDALDYLTWTLLYRRLAQNPNFYNLTGTTHRHLSDYLSELVDATLNDLSGSQCVEVHDEVDLTPLNLGMISAYYYVKYTTLEVFASSLTPKTKLRALIEVLCAASEFEALPIRHGEESTLKSLSHRARNSLPPPPEGRDVSSVFRDTHAKANILLQSHFSRLPVGGELRADQASVLEAGTQLVQALVDVISSEGWLKPALAAMELSQMTVQGLWAEDPVLMQVPHVTREIAERCAEYRAPKKSDKMAMNGEEDEDEDDEEEGGGVETVFDLINLPDTVRTSLLGLPAAALADVAAFCNRYPSISVTYEVASGPTVSADDRIVLQVMLERDSSTEGLEEGAGIGAVFAPRYPKPRSEGWWLVVGQPSTNTIAAIKRVTLGAAPSTTTIEFPPPDAAVAAAAAAGGHPAAAGSGGVGSSKQTFKLYFMSDSYLGCDQEYEFDVEVEATPA